MSNGETQSVPFTLNKGYPISPFKELGMGNQPPVLAFSQGGAKVTGPPTGVSASFTGTVNQPVAISVWVEDPKAPGETEAPPAGFGLSAGMSRPSRSTSSAGPGK